MRASRTVRIEILYGMRDMLPMSLAAATYGLAFGLLASQSGFNNFQTISMSALVLEVRLSLLLWTNWYSELVQLQLLLLVLL